MKLKAWGPTLLVLQIFAICASAQSVQQNSAVKASTGPDTRVMSDADFNVFLLEVEKVLPTWEAQLKNINLEKVPDLSYTPGKSISDNRDTALMEIGYARTEIFKLKHKRTVSGEISLKEFLDSLFSAGEAIVWMETLTGKSLTTLEKRATDLSPLIIRLTNDALARISLLEKASCPS